jgi:hypothetical protein
MSKNQADIWKAKLLVALEKSMGIVTPACKEVGVSRESFYRYYREDAEFKKKVDELEDFQLDFVENQLFNKIKQGSEKSIMFYMRYKGRKRGYKDSLDIDANVKIEQPLLKPLDEEDDINNGNTEDKKD